jgi:hypothetical protein
VDDRCGGGGDDGDDDDCVDVTRQYNYSERSLLFPTPLNFLFLPGTVDDLCFS